MPKYVKAINEMVRRATTLTLRIRRIINMEIRSIGIDLGKTTFHVVALGERGKVATREDIESAFAHAQLEKRSQRFAQSITSRS
jgi:hypothetical protein